MADPDDGDLVEQQGVDAGGPIDAGPDPTETGTPGGDRPAGAPNHAGALVEPDGTAQGGLLSGTDQHTGGPGQELAAGEG